MLSKNLIKASRLILKEEEPIVVDSNPLMARRMESVFTDLAGESKPKGFQSGLNATEIDLALIDMENGTYELDGILEDIPQENIYTGPTPEELIAQAQAEIDEMHREAEKNISFLKKRSMEEGRQEGYEEGRRQAMAELEAARKELEIQTVAMEEEYQRLISELEPKFIRTLTGIYEEIFNVDLKGYKNVLMHAISNTIRQIEGSKDFLVHVSKADYDKMLEQKEQLMNGLPSASATVELIADATLHENECMIETGSGIYDCSIGIQMEELTRKLRLLSYEE